MCLNNDIAHQPIALELFKPSKDSASLQVYNEKNFLGFGFRFLWVTA